jgi:D-alanyl-lipoteichoic acid acyltransferase DltB (MBOAT superfamily)
MTMDSVYQDVRYGVRMLLRNPGFTLVAIGVLAARTGEPWMLFSVATIANTLGSVVNWLIGRLHEQNKAADWPVIGIMLNLLLLGVCKFANFFAGSAAAILGMAFSPWDIILPLGISFFTFTQIAYLVDVYRRKAQEPVLANYALFVTFFPHLLAGPILHHSEMMPQFAEASNKRFNAANFQVGMTLLIQPMGGRLRWTREHLAEFARDGVALSDLVATARRCAPSTHHRAAP